MTAQIGDAVFYVPDKAHALDRDLNGDYPWAFKEIDERNSKVGDTEISDARVSAILNQIRPGVLTGKHLLVPARPKQRWPARVTAVYENGSADLDVCYVLPGCTHGLVCVPHDPGGTVPGSYHKPERAHDWHSPVQTELAANKAVPTKEIN